MFVGATLDLCAEHPVQPFHVRQVPPAPQCHPGKISAVEHNDNTFLLVLIEDYLLTVPLLLIQKQEL